MAADSVFLVTGAFGSLASRLIGLLAGEMPHGRVVAVGRLGAHRQALPPATEVVRGDLRNREVWTALPRTITQVFHLAAAIPWQREQKTLASVVSDNLWPLAHLLEHSQSWPHLRQIIFASSVAVYGWARETLHENSPKRPVDLYGTSKLAGEDLLLAAAARGVRIASLRYSSLFGKGQYPGTVIPMMIASATEERRIRVYGEGLRSQDFLHYDDAAEAALLAYRHAAEGAFNIGGGEPITMTELAELIRQVFTNGKAKVVHEREKPEGDPGFRIDIRKAATELSYRPRRDLRAGLVQLRRELEGG